MPTDPKHTKELGEALFDARGFLSYLSGSVIPLAITVGRVGGIFMSTRWLFRVQRVERNEDNNCS